VVSLEVAESAVFRVECRPDGGLEAAPGTEMAVWRAGSWANGHDDTLFLSVGREVSRRPFFSRAPPGSRLTHALNRHDMRNPSVHAESSTVWAKAVFHVLLRPVADHHSHWHHPLVAQLLFLSWSSNQR